MSDSRSPDAAALIATRDLVQTFPGGVQALRGVSLEVHGDDLLAILGPSGAGKSTLLRSLNRLIEPTGGAVLYRGRDVTRASGGDLRRLRQQVGMIFQQFNLVGRLTVLENVLAGRLRFTGWPFGRLMSHVRVFGGRHREVAYAALERVGIERQAFQRADTLSGGQQQRVAIARLLAQEPRVILADEPIASLDPRSAAVVMETLRVIHREEGIPVIVNLHQIEMARRYATRIVGMHEGRLVFDGSPAALDDAAVHRIYGDQPDAQSPVAKSASSPAPPPELHRPELSSS